MDTLRLHDGACRRVPTVLAVERSCLDFGRFERLGEERERRGTGNKRIAAPRDFERVADAVAVRVGEERIRAVDEFFQCVGESVAVGVAGGVGDEESGQRVVVGG